MAGDKSMTTPGSPINSKEILFVITVASSTILNGQVNGWSAVLPKLQEDTSRFTVTDGDVSWLVSLASASGVILTVVSGPLIERIGPRRLILWILVPALGSWLLMAFSPRLWLLYAGRAVGASGAVLLSTVVQPLVAELSPARTRGLFSTMPEVCGSLGLLLSFVLAYVTTWDVATAVSAGPLLPLIVLMLLVPESPYWLVRRGRMDEALKALRHLRGSKADVEAELSAIRSTPSCTQASVKDQFVELRKRQNHRPVVLLLVLFALRELGGRNAIFQYAVYIFHEADVELNPFTCTVLVGVTRLLCTCLSASASDRSGRTPLLLASAAVCSLAEGLAGVFLHFRLPGSSWVPLAAVLVFVASYGVGLGPVPWTYLGELLPSPVRSLGVSIVTFFYIISLFGVNYAFLRVISLLGLGMTMMAFAVCNLLVAAIAWLWIPESRGASLQELEKAFFQQEPSPQGSQNASSAIEEGHSSSTRSDQQRPAERNCSESALT